MPTQAEQKNYLLMFVWGRSTGLFKSIDNFGIDDLHVASLTIGYQPDIHVTFGSDNPLHITVREEAGGNANNGGAWNGKLVGLWPTLTQTGNMLNSQSLPAARLRLVSNYRARLNDIIDRLPDDQDVAFSEKVEDCASRSLISPSDLSGLHGLYRRISNGH